MILKADRVYEVLQEDFEGGTKDNPLALLFMVVVSMSITAAVVVGILLWSQVKYPPWAIFAVVLVSWVLAYFLGKVFGQSQGYNDNIQRDIEQTPNFSLGLQSRSDYSADMMGIGCLLALMQFAFGGIYTGINALFFGSAGKMGDKLRLATAIVVLLYSQPQENFAVSKISTALQTAGLPTPPKRLQKTIQMLVAKNFIHGTLELGYGCNSSQVDRFL